MNNPNEHSSRVRSLLKSPGRYEELLLSAISVWGFTKLVEKGRMGISYDPESWIERALDMPKLRLVPLTPAGRSTALPKPFHGDPADQIIVAPAREENATMLTKDQRIRRYKHVLSFW